MDTEHPPRHFPVRQPQCRCSSTGVFREKPAQATPSRVTAARERRIGVERLVVAASPAREARDGSIDWLCLPRFDSGACFAALLGAPGNFPQALTHMALINTARLLSLPQRQRQIEASSQKGERPAAAVPTP